MHNVRAYTEHIARVDADHGAKINCSAVMTYFHPSYPIYPVDWYALDSHI